MHVELAVLVERLSRRFGAREALRSVNFQVQAGEILGVLGPNGGGKTTLFRILSTSLQPTSGRASVFGFDVVGQADAVRRQVGVVFQSPSLDKKLTAAENLWHHGMLYGMYGRSLRMQVSEMLARVGLADRTGDRVERLSGGMQRRVEVAKGLLTRPRLLIMDEPSTGLDPGARRDLWEYLKQVRERDALTILLTTHLTDEADQCDQVAIIDHGQLVAFDTPKALTDAVGTEVVSLETDNPAELANQITSQMNLSCRVVENAVRIEHERGHELVAQLFRTFPSAIRSVTVRRSTLEDVFLQRTGRRLWDEDRGSRTEDRG